MTDKDFHRLSRSELVEIIHQLQDNENTDTASLPTAEQVETERSSLKKKARLKKTLRNTIAILVVVAAIAVLLSTLFLPVIQVSGDSMEPTLHNGDVIVLHKTKKFKSGQLCCVSWQNKLLLKRVIGLPGDYIKIDEEGNVYVNNELIDEPYAQNKCLGECDITFPYLVPEGKLFVLGDRRDTSIDSRSSAIGCVDKEQIIGQVLFKIWPLGNS